MVRVRVRVRVSERERDREREGRVRDRVRHLDMKASSTRLGCPFLAIMVLRTFAGQDNR